MDSKNIVKIIIFIILMIGIFGSLIYFGVLSNLSLYIGEMNTRLFAHIPPAFKWLLGLLSFIMVFIFIKWFTD